MSLSLSTITKSQFCDGKKIQRKSGITSMYDLICLPNILRLSAFDFDHFQCTMELRILIIPHLLHSHHWHHRQRECKQSAPVKLWQVLWAVEIYDSLGRRQPLDFYLWPESYFIVVHSTSLPSSSSSVLCKMLALKILPPRRTPAETFWYFSISD